jgi:flagellar hook-length control protein FliK
MNVTTNNFAAPAAAPATGPAPGLGSDPAPAPQAQGAVPFAQWLVQDEPIPAPLPDLSTDASGPADPVVPAKANALAGTDSDDADAPSAAPPDGALLAAMSMPLMAPAAAPAPTAAPGTVPSAADPIQMMALAATAQSAGPGQLATPQPAGTGRSAAPQPAGASQSAAPQPAGASQSAPPQPAGTSQWATPAPSAAPDSLAAAAAAQLAATLVPAPRAASPAATGAATAPAPASPAAPAPDALAATAAQPGNAGNAAAGNGSDTQDRSSASAAAPVWGVAAPAAGNQPAADPVALAGPPAAWRQPLQDALGERLQMQLGNHMEQAVIRLEPPMLGRIEIAIRHTAGALEVSLTATHSEVVRQLQTVSENLRNDLSGRQYTEVAVSVSQAPRAQAANPNAFADQQGGRQRQGAREQQDAEPGLALADAGNASSTFSLNARE